MSVTQTFAIGSRVKVVNCGSCSAVVGKIASVRDVSEDGRIRLNFGRGRPSRNRPEFFNASDLELVEDNAG
jgi:hypothetical protein